MITRKDFEAISNWIKPASSVLDLGCGDGELLVHLKESRNITGYGIENDDAGILACVANGVNVIQSNLESGLKEVGDGAFDYVILSQTLQAMKRTEAVIDEMLRLKVDIEGLNRQRESALDVAGGVGQQDSLGRLLEAGADPLLAGRR